MTTKDVKTDWSVLLSFVVVAELLKMLAVVLLLILEIGSNWVVRFFT
jgi:hypothetical protein